MTDIVEIQSPDGETYKPRPWPPAFDPDLFREVTASQGLDVITAHHMVIDPTPSPPAGQVNALCGAELEMTTRTWELVNCGECRNIERERTAT